MTPQPTPSTTTPPALQLAWHRGLQRLGWPGLLGLGFVVLAAVVGVGAWQARQALSAVEREEAGRRDRHPPALGAAVVPVDAGRAVNDITVASRSDIHALVGQIQEAAQQRQLAWEAADYRWKPATADGFARLEVHGSVKGPYRSMRLWLEQLQSEVPALMLREASFSRPHPDAAEVDAKLVLVVPLAEEENGSMPVAPAAKAGP